MPSIAVGDTLFGRYVVEKMEGEGFFGRVYLARDKILLRPVAIKELKPHWVGEPDVMKRFLGDARAAAHLQHPNIVEIIDVQPEDKPRFIILERLTETLGQLMKREGRLSMQRSACIAADICSALELAHVHGIIHRDIKPGNLLFAPTGAIKICDFGIAHLPRDLGGGETVLEPGMGHPGTLAYKSPEQVKGLPLDGRSDLYTVGAVLYEMLTGRHYFDYSKMSRFEIDEFIVHGVPAPPSRFLSTIPPDLDAVIMRLLEKDPAARFPDAAAVSQALGKFAARDESRVGAAFLPVLTAISTAALRERKRTRFRVRLEATNEGDTEANNWCGLTLHFPTLSDKDRIAANDIHAWGSADLFIRFPGDLIWGFGHHGKWGEIPAKHLMIEFAVQQWSPGEHFHLEAALLLEASEIQVHARAWGSLKKPDESVIQSNDPGWSNADTKDQQGFPCNVLVIGLKH